VLKELLDAWRSKDILARMFERFSRMLRHAEWMYDAAYAALTKGVIDDDTIRELYATDKKINKAERKIRKQIVEHLTLRPSVDTTACLVLMSVVKDAERIGDFCKNIFEVALMFKRPVTDGSYANEIQSLYERIRTLGADTRRAFDESDEELARDVIRSDEVLSKECDALIVRLAGDTVPTDEAVAFALLSRFFKRIAGHLTNIATSVVAPLHKLDYAPKHKTKRTFFEGTGSNGPRTPEKPA